MSSEQYAGYAVIIRGTEHLISALSIRDFKDQFNLITRLTNHMNAEEVKALDPQTYLSEALPIVLLAVKRNYPDLTLEYLKKVDLSTFRQLFLIALGRHDGERETPEAFHTRHGRTWIAPNPPRLTDIPVIPVTHPAEAGSDAYSRALSPESRRTAETAAHAFTQKITGDPVATSTAIELILSRHPFQSLQAVAALTTRDAVIAGSLRGLLAAADDEQKAKRLSELHRSGKPDSVQL